MKNKLYKIIIVIQFTMIIALTWYSIFGIKGREVTKVKNDEVLPFCTIDSVSGREFLNVLEDFIHKSDDDKYYTSEFVTITEEYYKNPDTVRYCLSYEGPKNLISGYLNINVLLPSVAGKQIIFRPRRINTNYFTTIDTMLLKYITKYDSCVADNFRQQIEYNHNLPAPWTRSFNFFSGPGFRAAYVRFDNNGKFIDSTYLDYYGKR